MSKLTRLILVLLVLSGLYLYRWYNVPYLSISRHAFTKQEMDGFYERDRQEKINLRNASIARRLFHAYGCDENNGDDISFYVGRHLQNLSPRLVAAVIIVESTCQPEAVSPSGAIGLMQIMPAKRYTRKELLQPERNIEIGTRILKNNIERTGSTYEGIKRYYGDFPGNEEYAEKIMNIARIN